MLVVRSVICPLISENTVNYCTVMKIYFARHGFALLLEEQSYFILNISPVYQQQVILRGHQDKECYQIGSSPSYRVLLTPKSLQDHFLLVAFFHTPLTKQKRDYSKSIIVYLFIYLQIRTMHMRENNRTNSPPTMFTQLIQPLTQSYNLLQFNLLQLSGSWPRLWSLSQHLQYTVSWSHCAEQISTEVAWDHAQIHKA